MSPLTGCRGSPCAASSCDGLGHLRSAASLTPNRTLERSRRPRSEALPAYSITPRTPRLVKARGYSRSRARVGLYSPPYPGSTASLRRQTSRRRTPYRSSHVQQTAWPPLPLLTAPHAIRSQSCLRSGPCLCRLSTCLTRQTLQSPPRSRSSLVTGMYSSVGGSGLWRRGLRRLPLMAAGVSGLRARPTKPASRSRLSKASPVAAMNSAASLMPVSGQAEDHLGVRMVANPGLDEGVEFSDLLRGPSPPFARRTTMAAAGSSPGSAVICAGAASTARRASLDTCTTPGAFAMVKPGRRQPCDQDN